MFRRSAGHGIDSAVDIFTFISGLSLDHDVPVEVLYGAAKFIFSISIELQCMRLIVVKHGSDLIQAAFIPYLAGANNRRTEPRFDLGALLIVLDGIEAKLPVRLIAL